MMVLGALDKVPISVKTMSIFLHNWSQKLEMRFNFYFKKNFEYESKA